MSLALLCDAVIGNVQEGAMKKYKESTTHVVLYSYAIGFFLILIGLIILGTMNSAVVFANQVSFFCVNFQANIFTLYFKI